MNISTHSNIICKLLRQSSYHNQSIKELIKQTNKTNKGSELPVYHPPNLTFVCQAYWNVATKRLVDNVCMTLEQDFTVKLLSKVESELFLLTNRFTEVEELFIEVRYDLIWCGVVWFGLSSVWFDFSLCHFIQFALFCSIFVGLLQCCSFILL